jgi:hypothetical protein
MSIDADVSFVLVGKRPWSAAFEGIVCRGVQREHSSKLTQALSIVKR